MSNSYSHILSIPTVICGFISFISCVYVCISAIRSGYIPCKPLKKKLSKSMSWQTLQQKLKRHSQSKDRMVVPELREHMNMNSSKPRSKQYSDTNHPTMMIDILFWMCVCDGLYAIQIICNWFPLAFDLTFWRMTPCHILGITAQFLTIQSPCWHVLLAYNLGYLLLGGSITKLTSHKKYEFLIVNLVPFICTILPFLFSEYGKYENNIKYNDIECWITSELWQYVYVIVIIISILLHYIVIIIAISKWKDYSQSGFDQHFKFIIVKLLRFIVIYTIIRFFPVLNHIWEFSSPNSAPVPFILILAHHIGISLLGFSDALVYFINQKQIPYQKQKNKQKSYTAFKNHPDNHVVDDKTHMDDIETDDIETTDYWISTNIIHFKSAPKHKTNNTYSAAEFDVTTCTLENDPESQCIWSLEA